MSTNDEECAQAAERIDVASPILTSAVSTETASDKERPSVPVPELERQYKYKAFISYSHAADDALAPQLQSMLQQFAKPWYRLRAIRVFRDKTGLAVTASLWPAIEAALEEACFFVLLASPEAAQSQWVAREVSWWLGRRSADRILIVWTGGELVWRHDKNDFDWSSTTALPDVLRGVFAHQPLYLDLRWAKRKTDASPRRGAVRDAVARLASTLRGQALDELIGEDVRQHRKLRNFSAGAIAAVLAFGVIATWQAVVARREATAAEDRRLEAEARLATASHAMDQVSVLIDNKFTPGVEAIDVKPDLVALVADTERALASTGATGLNERVIEMSTHRIKADIAEAHSDWATAEREYSTALQIGEEALWASPTDSAIRQDVAVNHRHLSILASKTGDKSRARAELTKALDQTAELLADVPQNDVIRGNLVDYYDEVGAIEQDDGDEHAIASFKTAISVAAARSKPPQYSREIDLPLAQAYEHLATIQYARGDTKSAISYGQAAVSIREQGTSVFPEAFRGQDLALDYVQLANAMDRDHDYAGVVRELDLAIKYLDRVHVEHPQLRDVVADQWLIRGRLLVYSVTQRDAAAEATRFAQFLDTDASFQAIAQLDTFTGLAPDIEATVTVASELDALGAHQSAKAVAKRAVTLLDAARADDRRVGWATLIVVSEMSRLLTVLGDGAINSVRRDAVGCLRMLDRASRSLALRCGYSIIAVADAALVRDDLNDASFRVLELDQIGKHIADLHSFDSLAYEVMAVNLSASILLAKHDNDAAAKVSNTALALARELVKKAPDDATPWTRLLLGETLAIAVPSSTGAEKISRLREAASLLEGLAPGKLQVLQAASQLQLASELLTTRDVTGARDALLSVQGSIFQHTATGIPDGNEAKWMMLTWIWMDMQAKLAIANNAKVDCLMAVGGLDQIATHLAGTPSGPPRVEAARGRRAECEALK